MYAKTNNVWGEKHGTKNIYTTPARKAQVSSYNVFTVASTMYLWETAAVDDSMLGDNSHHPHTQAPSDIVH